MLEKEPTFLIKPKGIDLENYWYEIELGMNWALEDYQFTCDHCNCRTRVIYRVKSPLCLYVCNWCAMFSLFW